MWKADVLLADVVTAEMPPNSEKSEEEEGMHDGTSEAHQSLFHDRCGPATWPEGAALLVTPYLHKWALSLDRYFQNFAYLEKLLS